MLQAKSPSTEEGPALYAGGARDELYNLLLLRVVNVLNTWILCNSV